MIWELIREIIRGNNVPLFNHKWFDLRSSEMFVQQYEISTQISPLLYFIEVGTFHLFVVHLWCRSSGGEALVGDHCCIGNLTYTFPDVQVLSDFLLDHKFLLHSAVLYCFGPLNIDKILLDFFLKKIITLIV